MSRAGDGGRERWIRSRALRTAAGGNASRQNSAITTAMTTTTATMTVSPSLGSREAVRWTVGLYCDDATTLNVSERHDDALKHSKFPASPLTLGVQHVADAGSFIASSC